jgi:hypothetical protein
MDALEAVTTTLAAWRLASLLVNEDGPGAVFSKLRYRAGIRHVVVQGADGTAQASTVATNSLAEGLTCVWCTSVWAACALVALSALPYPVRSLVKVGKDIFAISAGAILVHEAVERCRR